jgi:glycine C-acetyltransferase
MRTRTSTPAPCHLSSWPEFSKRLRSVRASRNFRRQLWENADYFHRGLNTLGIDTGNSTTYVMPIVIGDRERMYRFGHELRSRGLWVAPVDYPAVPQDRICFRACVTARHTRADLDEALNILADTLVPSLIAQNA